MAHNGNVDDVYNKEAVSEEYIPGGALDLDAKRRAALAEIDNAKFGWFHVRACLVAGVGFFTDAYDIFAISIGATMIGLVYNQGANKGKLTNSQNLGLNVATPVGTLIGQLLFGWLADVYGRKRMYGIELMIIIVGTIGQAVAGQAPAVSILGVLIFWRVFMGIGIGGDYPLSATITSEFAATRIRGRMMTAVFAMQGFGNLASAIVALVVTSAYKNKMLYEDLPGAPVSVDYCWRLLIGLGAVPGCIALYFRLTIPETPRYTMDVERNVKQAANDVDAFLSTGHYVHDYDAQVVKAEAPKATRRDFIAHFSKWENGKVLFGASWSWFALDIAFYGLGLNSSIILQAIGFGSVNGSTPQETIYSTLRNVAVGNIILAVAGLIPGYWASFFIIDSVGRKPIQLMGFSMMTILFIIMGFAYQPLVKNAVGAFVFLYCLTNFFQNFGPNTTTFIIPGEAFPTRYRSTAHGICAASGKASKKSFRRRSFWRLDSASDIRKFSFPLGQQFGAIVAQVAFLYLKDVGGASGSGVFIPHILEIFAAVMISGIGATLLLPETMGKTLEELSNEPQEGFVKPVDPKKAAVHV